MLQYRIADDIEEYKVPSEVPHKSSITEEFLPALLKARNVTRKPASNAPKNAERFIGEIIRWFERNNTAGRGMNNEAATAARVAPEVIPKMAGSARGFLKKIWKVAPLPPRRRPVKSTRRERGSLRFHIIVC